MALWICLRSRSTNVPFEVLLAGYSAFKVGLFDDEGVLQIARSECIDASDGRL